jgi:hypothetical protein
MTTPVITVEMVVRQVNQLSLREQVQLVERILSGLAQQLPTTSALHKPLRSLYGLWQGFTVTEADITEARRELWGQFAERRL